MVATPVTEYVEDPPKQNLKKNVTQFERSYPHLFTHAYGTRYDTQYTMYTHMNGRKPIGKIDKIKTIQKSEISKINTGLCTGNGQWRTGR